MKHISWCNPINLYVTERLNKFSKLLFSFYLVISKKGRTNALFSDVCVPFPEFQVGRVTFDGTNYYIFIFDTIFAVQNLVSVFWNFKTFQVITIKLRRFRLRKCYFGVLAVEYKQIGFQKNADTVLDCKLRQVWQCNNWCHQMQYVRVAAPEREHKGRKTRRSFSLFIWNDQIKIKQRFWIFNKLFKDI